MQPPSRLARGSFDAIYALAHGGEAQGNGLALAVLDEGALQRLSVALQERLDAGDVQLVPGLDAQISQAVHNEGEHAPVHHVGAIALSGVLRRQIGHTAQHSLAGGGLLSCRAVAGLQRHDQGAEAGGLGIVPIQSGQHLGVQLTGLTLFLQLLNIRRRCIHQRKKA